MVVGGVEGKNRDKSQRHMILRKIKDKTVSLELVNKMIQWWKYYTYLVFKVENIDLYSDKFLNFLSSTVH